MQGFIYFRSTMAWGLEARVPFLDKAFLEVAMNIAPKEKMFSKGVQQEVDEDGCCKMEKVGYSSIDLISWTDGWRSISFEKHLIFLLTARWAQKAR